MNLVKEYAKTLAAFVAGVVANIATDLINGKTPWPQTGAEWSRYLITSFGAAIAVALTRNKITQQQLDKDPNVVGGVVVADPRAAQDPMGNININVAPDVDQRAVRDAIIQAQQYKNPWR